MLMLFAGIGAMAQGEIAKSSPETGPAGPVPFLLARGVPVVQVVLNGHGPYSFLVDTGTNVTLVEQPVLDQLSVSAQTIVSIHSTTGDGATSEATLESIAVGNLNLHKMEVAVLKHGQLAIYGDRVLGVLGENFLKHFDLVLDYQHGVLLLDSSSALGDSLMGEHVAFRSSGLSREGVVPNRILVQSKLPAFEARPLACLVDSGAHLAVIFLQERLIRWRLQGARAQTNLRSPIGSSSPCLIEPSGVEVGSERVRRTDVVACEENKRSDADFDCLLPTNLFRSVFISHRGGYIVMNPQFVERASLVP
jgi:predicted aspartyl protease